MGELFEDLSKVRLEELCVSDRLRAWYLLDLSDIGDPVLIMETPEGIILAGDGAPGGLRLAASHAPGYAYNAKWFAQDLHPSYLMEKFDHGRVRDSEVNESEEGTFELVPFHEFVKQPPLSSFNRQFKHRLIAIHRAFRALYEG